MEPGAYLRDTIYIHDFRSIDATKNRRIELSRKRIERSAGDVSSVAGVNARVVSSSFNPIDAGDIEKHRTIIFLDEKAANVGRIRTQRGYEFIQPTG